MAMAMAKVYRLGGPDDIAGVFFFSFGLVRVFETVPVGEATFALLGMEEAGVDG